MVDYSINIIKDTSYTIELNEQGPQGIQGERGIQGPEGPVGPKGDKGDVGDKGDTGVSVVGVEEISKVGLVTTYRMEFSNGEYFDYQVTDGSIDGLTREQVISLIGYEPASYTSVEGLTASKANISLNNLDEVGEKRFTDIQIALDGKQDKGKSGSGLEVCDIGMALYVDETKGLRRYLNGQIVDINTNTQAFLNRLKQITTLYPSLLCTEDEWQTAKTLSAFGQVGKFVFNYSGDEIVSVRLPRVVNVQGLFDLQNLGMTVVAGLPTHKHTRGTMNITGKWVSYSGLREGASPDGAVYSESTVGTGSMPGGGDPKQRLAFDASRSWIGSTSVPDNSIYGNTNTVQPEAIQYPYFIQIATGQETENNIVNEIELNNPSFFGDSKYVPTAVNNLSWLKSEGQSNPKGTYPSFYDWILENVNKGIDKFKTSSSYCYKKQDSDYGVWTNSVSPVVGMSVYGHTPMQQIGTISALVENGFTYYDTKLKADTTVYRYTSADNRADYITDYDFYIDTDNETFRLPLLNGSEDLPSDNFTSFGISSLDTTGYTFTASCNGYVFFTGWQSNITAGLLITVNNHLRWFSGLATANQTFRPTCYLFVNKGDVVHVYGEKGTISINTPSIDFGFYKAQGNGSLYFYVGETVQNANLIDAGRIGEILPTKLDASKVKAYIVETYQKGTSWYRIWSDGWCEQGGQTAAKGAASTVTTVNFLKPFANANYCALATDYATTTSVVYFGCTSFTTSSMAIITNAGAGRACRWMVAGYIN